MTDWDWEGARKHFERAIELNPNYATAHHWYGEAYLTPMGRLDESLAEIRVAQRLDPLSCVIGADIGKTLYFARRYDEAISQLRSVLEMDSNCYPAYSWLRPAYEGAGRYAQALEVFEKEKAFIDRDQYLSVQIYINSRMGQTVQARQFMTQLLKLAETQPVDPGLIAGEYIYLGEKDQAFAWLNRAYAARSNYMSSLKVWSLYDPLRNDPRFIDLERRVKLTPE
jgi:tetratricopeptide (TPR) repeat protein